MLTKLWNDESGIVTLEYLILASMVGLGAIAGMHELSQGVSAEMTETSKSIVGLTQTYRTNATSSANATFGGSQATDARTSSPSTTATPATLPTSIPTSDAIICP